ncbi:MAG: radical SAM protein [Nitrospirales bacterium]
MRIQDISTQSILNPTGGFLKEGFTHTINLYRGCALGNSLCGLYCYAQWNPYHTLGRAWGSFLDVKSGAAEVYRTQYERLKGPRAGQPKPLDIFMSSVTEPYPPQERTTRRTRVLLEAMVLQPPDSLIIQTHTPLIVDDLEVLRRLHARCRLQINMTVETDMATLPAGFPPHAYSPTSRIDALYTLHEAGLPTVATISPLLPLADPRRFAETLEPVCDRVILDHYLLGDGSPQGRRTKHTALPRLLAEAGYEAWTHLDMFESVVALFREVFGAPDRVGVSRAGFNAR